MRGLALVRGAVSVVFGGLLLVLGSSCGLFLDPDPPFDAVVVDPSGCRRDSECPGCAICIAGGCASAAGQPCTRRGRCVQGVYTCTDDASSPECESTDIVAEAGDVCRPARDDCDAEEICDGTTRECPPDAQYPAGTPCSGGICDAEGDCDDPCVPGESCSTGYDCEEGVTRCEDGREVCVAVGVLGLGTECREQADDAPCDVPEFCDGVSPSCPSDGAADDTVVCRAGTHDVCDPTEMCDGVSPLCPADVFAPVGVVCSAGDAEWCDGLGGCGPCIEGTDCSTGNACEEGTTECAADGAPPRCIGIGEVPAGTECRAAAGACDVAEVCDGSSLACPLDDFVAAGTECRGAAGACDEAESCSGSDPSCPADLTLAIGTECRAVTDICDIAEGCQSGIDCPADTFERSSQVCRAGVAVCDMTEYCTGSTPTCPTDRLASGSTNCRPAADICDVAETCDGISPTCPGDGFAPAGMVCPTGICDGMGLCFACTPGAPCSTGNACEVGEIDCTGGMEACVARGPATPGTTCRASDGVCDIEEVCDGVSLACPRDDVVADGGMECRASAGACDRAEVCNGVSPDCPPNGFRNSAAICRASVGTCDFPEYCSGGNADCPMDRVAAMDAPCRGEAGLCDRPEVCDGVSGSCPTDLFLPSGTTCRFAVDTQCDVPEVCTGGDGACPDDGYAPAYSSCGACGACDGMGTCYEAPTRPCAGGFSLCCPSTLFSGISVCVTPGLLCPSG